MSDIVLRSTTRAQVELRALGEKLVERLRSEEGQDTIEYIGVLIVVAAIIAIVLTAVKAVDFKSAIDGLINNVFSGNKNPAPVTVGNS